MRITNDTVIIITGASSGIGRALALECAERGARLGLIARRGDRLQEVAEECRQAGSPEALPVVCDVSERESYIRELQNLLRHFGHVDVLVNNAGAGHFSFIGETPQDHIESVFGSNLYPLWYGAEALLPSMKERKSGQIITIASIAGILPFPANAAYVAAKHGAIGFARALRAELAGTGVESLLVLPGGVLTDWATSTVGGPILPLFEYEGVRGKEIADELGLEQQELPSLLPPEEVVRQIAELIEDPQPVLYTHPGTKELGLAYLNDPLGMEERLKASWMANREGYEGMKSSLSS